MGREALTDMTNLRFDLERFVLAQAPVYRDVLAELAAGKKRSHWMWFIFPQLRGLGRSATALHFGLDGREEAMAYWHHPVLGPRLKACTARVLALAGVSANAVFGRPDDLKFRSCMTLFATVAPEEPVFAEALSRYFEGQCDEATLKLLE